MSYPTPERVSGIKITLTLSLSHSAVAEGYGGLRKGEGTAGEHAPKVLSPSWERI